MFKLSTFVLSILFTFGAYAGGEGSGPGIVKLLQAQVMSDNTFIGNTEFGSFNQKIDSARFIGISPEGIAFKVLSEIGETTFITPEESLEESSLLSDVIFESFNDNGNWINF